MNIRPHLLPSPATIAETIYRKNKQAKPVQLQGMYACIYQQVRDTLTATSAKVIYWKNKEVQYVQFKIGDAVMIELSEKTKKLASKFTGPFLCEGQPDHKRKRNGPL